MRVGRKIGTEEDTENRLMEERRVDEYNRRKE